MLSLFTNKTEVCTNYLSIFPSGKFPGDHKRLVDKDRVNEAINQELYWDIIVYWQE